MEVVASEWSEWRGCEWMGVGETVWELVEVGGSTWA